MKTIALIVLFLSAFSRGQILTKPTQKIVPVEDNSGLIMDIYKQTNAQNAQLSSMATQVSDIKESVARIETAEHKSDENIAAMRHDVDKQGVIASLFAYTAQTLFTIIIAIFITVPGTFFVQKILNERVSKPTQPADPV
jgi:hypothetical protein